MARALPTCSVVLGKKPLPVSLSWVPEPQMHRRITRVCRATVAVGAWAATATVSVRSGTPGELARTRIVAPSGMSPIPRRSLNRLKTKGPPGPEVFPARNRRSRRWGTFSAVKVITALNADYGDGAPSESSTGAHAVAERS